ncbi:MAG: 1,4-alpha-glucan branching protein domain-containing protein [bacterium]
MLGYFTFVLHTHLPYVLHHGKWPFGSDWLSEAVAECYIPIIEKLESLHQADVPVKISMDFSPVLLEQLADPDFPTVFNDYCDERIKLAKADKKSFKDSEAELLELAEYWIDFYKETKRIFNKKYSNNIIARLKHLSHAGVLDAMTCAATHGYFPLLVDDRNIRAQIQIAIATHEKYFGKRPKGIWLPECAYRPRYWWTPQTASARYSEFSKERAGIEEILAEFDLRYFIVEGSLTKGGKAMPSYHWNSNNHSAEDSFDWAKYFFQTSEHEDRSLSNIYAVKSTLREIPGKLPVVFSRDRKTSEQVWSGEIGYPGHPNYLEFHKKHHNSGLRYWKVTGRGVDIGGKKLFEPTATDATLEIQATHFVNLVKTTLHEHRAKTGKPGVVCSPFDTELFGHWWYEGPGFLKLVFEKLSKDNDIVLSNCAEIIEALPNPEIIALPEGSWGEGGGHFVWQNQKVAWTWDDIYSLEKKFLDTLNEYFQIANPAKFLTKILKQSARELLLLEASDWQFLITTDSATEYSTDRFEEHRRRLTKLLTISERVMNGKKQTPKDKDYLELVSEDDRLFEEIDLSWWL